LTSYGRDGQNLLLVFLKKKKKDKSKDGPKGSSVVTLLDENSKSNQKHNGLLENIWCVWVCL
jgi:hypothetical protein